MANNFRDNQQKAKNYDNTMENNQTRQGGLPLDDHKRQSKEKIESGKGENSVQQKK